MTAVHGTVAPGFEAVREELAAALEEEHAATGAASPVQLTAYAGDRQVVDLWSGDGMAGDSLLPVYSVTKGAAHLVTALLVQEGVLDLDERVAHYWPEFAAEGKGALSLRDLLAHRAGSIGVDGGFTPEEYADDRRLAERLAAHRPYWRPGSAHGYHATTIGALTGEVVRRTTGRSLQQVYEERIRAPYGLDLWLGLPESQEPRVRETLPMAPTERQRRLLAKHAPGPRSLMGIAFGAGHPERPLDLDTVMNDRAMRAKGPASLGGVGSARGVAGLYAAAVSGTGGRPALLKPETLAEFGQIHSPGYDVVVRSTHSFALGFESTADVYPFLGAGSIGHQGAAGALGLADPGSGLAYGYVRQRYGYPGGAAPENDRLLRAVHAALTRG
ncbi:serine hydrolase domain-containing protein [Streptomyces sp. NPDC051940]|uniref:serine hydrolase domain-containing protein n=1 Tax=Streptomyces sp. NPDC051940 TaxID=3155675 RepID=UPI0034267B69